jgi:acetyl-CoA acyltransferase
MKSTKKRTAVVIGGVRTPFLRAFGDFTPLGTIDLGVSAIKGLFKRFPIAWKEIDSIIWSGVVLPGATVNIGREILFDLGLPMTIDAYTITRVCTSSLKAITLAVDAIERGDADVIIAGGSDSTSNAEVTMPQSLVHKFAPVVLNPKSGVKDYFRVLTTLNPIKDLIPQRPAIKERITGELMGESAEKMATRNQISREAQDMFALQSHQRAAKAIATGRFDSEITPVELSKTKAVHADNIVRGNTSLEKLGKLKPAFAKNGTLTAGNSSTLTDGAAAVLMMEFEKAKSIGFTPLATFRAWSYDAVDPTDQLLIGPALSMPKAIKKAGMTRNDIDLIDIHEAFAAQVLSVLKMLASDHFARDRLGFDKAFGFVDPKEINVHGGSVALGHPFAATGARMVSTMANELKFSGKETALLGICGAGALSAAAVMEAV